jgi:hypothetical protein
MDFYIPWWIVFATLALDCRSLVEQVRRQEGSQDADHSDGIANLMPD